MNEHKSAVISEDQKYRYKLSRTWNENEPGIVFIGLNPSTADHEKDDATIRRLRGFCKDWGAGGFVIVNLFALRSRNPFALETDPDCIGPKNNDWIIRTTFKSLITKVIPCWGNHGKLWGRDQEVLKMLPHWKLYHLGLSKAGNPKHPLYLPSSTIPTKWDLTQIK